MGLFDTKSSLIVLSFLPNFITLVELQEGHIFISFGISVISALYSSLEENSSSTLILLSPSSFKVSNNDL